MAVKPEPGNDIQKPEEFFQPASINLPKMGVGDVFYGELTLTNHGLVRAEDMVAKLPGNDGNDGNGGGCS